MTFLLLLILLLVGFYAVTTKRNLFKILMGFMIMRFALYLLIVTASNAHAGGNHELFVLGRSFIQSLIGIELGISIFGAGLVIKVFQKYGTMDISRIRKLRG